MTVLRLATGVLLAAAVSALACDPSILVGAEGADAAAGPVGDDGGLLPLDVPWSTGFEDGFNDWSEPSSQGYCYLMAGASFDIVTSPVHSGQFAAAFTVDSSASMSQTRCVRQGVLPQAAYYGAWYYVPAVSTNTGNWNLLHFRGGAGPDAATHGLWDVSLVNDADGGLATSVYDDLRARQLDAGTAIPIGQWFHLEAYLRPADDGTGRFTLYRDGQVEVDLSGIPTDDAAWGAWHVGNLATALSPSISTLYVDDVTIETTGP